MIFKFLTLTLKSLRYRRLRSWLTILGVVIGVMLVVVIFSLSNGIKTAISRTLQTFGNDLIIIFPGKETNPFTGILAGSRFKADDITSLSQIPGVELVLPVDLKSFNVEYRGEKQTTYAHAGPLAPMKVIFEESRGVKFSEGGWQETEDSNQVILGSTVASTLFKSPIRVGDEVIIQSKRVKVSGIFDKLGSQEDDSSIFMTWGLLRSITGASPGVLSVLVKVAADVDVEAVAGQIELRLARQTVVSDFSVLTPDKAGRIVTDVLSIVEISLMVIALISVLVGAVGIMNTMYTTVLERTKQIGIFKAVGASRENILTMFLIESGIIGFVGGVLGILSGVTLAYIIGLAAGRVGFYRLFSFDSIDYGAFLIILLITIAIGIISGILPARQAAKLEPAEALRYE